MIAVARWSTGVLGIGTGLYGLVLLLDLGWDNLVDVGTWLVGGVLLHDAVLAPVTIVVAFVLARVLGGRIPAPVIIGGIVLSTVTIVAIPVLGRFGAKADNDTLLDRSYGIGWLVFAAITVTVVGLALLRERRRQNVQTE